jgi:hypothetical protein
MTVYNIDPERRNPYPLWTALDYVVNAGLVEGDTPDDRMQSAIIETWYEINQDDRAVGYEQTPISQVSEYVTAHYNPNK